MEETGMLTTSDAAAMCPRCGGDGYVKKTYDRPDGARIRIRKCTSCGYRFRTRETLWPWGTAEEKKQQKKSPRG